MDWDLYLGWCVCVWWRAETSGEMQSVSVAFIWSWYFYQLCWQEHWVLARNMLAQHGAGILAVLSLCGDTAFDVCV